MPENSHQKQGTGAGAASLHNVSAKTEKLSDNGQGEKKESFSKRKNGRDIDVDKEIIIHTMPERFLPRRQSANHRSKSIGLVILISGIIALLMIGVLFYYYFSRPAEQPLPGNLLSSNTSADKRSEPPAVLPPDTAAKDKKENESASSGASENGAKIPSVDISRKEAESNGQSSSTLSLMAKAGQATTTKPTIPVIINQPAATSTLPVSYKKPADADGDGLSDLEEALLGCDRNSRDSDADGYADKSELMNLYNPAGSGTLMVNAGIEKYVNDSYGYYLYYPVSWTIENMGGDDSVMFKINDRQFIQIIIQPNSNRQNLTEWYKKYVGVSAIKSNQTVYKTGWIGLKSEDKLTVYLTKRNSNRIFVVTYNPGADNVLNYENIFNMMIKSLEFVSG